MKKSELQKFLNGIEGDPEIDLSVCILDDESDIIRIIADFMLGEYVPSDSTITLLAEGSFCLQENKDVLIKADNSIEVQNEE